jgi:hypothetical protein
MRAMDDDHLIPPRSPATRLADADEAYIRAGHVPLADVAGRRLDEVRTAGCGRPALSARASRSALPGTEGNEPCPRRRRERAPLTLRRFCAIRGPLATPWASPRGVDAEIHL